MNTKSLMTVALGSFFLAACSTAPVSQHHPQPSLNDQPIEFTEPKVTPAFYALNPLSYNQPSEFEVHLIQAQTATVNKLKVTDPKNPAAPELILDKNLLIIPLTNSKDKNLRYGVLPQDNELDVTDIDDFLNILEGKARHYPVHFASARERDGATDKLKVILGTLDSYAANPNASYDVLLRAAKANGMARNMDMGEQYGPKALNYAKRMLAMKPNDPTISFWLGFALSEGGAFKEATPYLKTAIDAGIQEAYLSMANNYLYMEQKKNAITTLKNYKVKFPDEAAVADALIQDIESGHRYNVWQTKK